MSKVDIELIIPKDKLNNFRYIQLKLCDVKCNILQSISKNLNISMHDLINKYIPEMNKTYYNELYTKYNIDNEIDEKKEDNGTNEKEEKRKSKKKENDEKKETKRKSKKKENDEIDEKKEDERKEKRKSKKKENDEIDEKKEDERKETKRKSKKKDINKENNSSSSLNDV
jgi:hypothetical protein